MPKVFSGRSPDGTEFSMTTYSIGERCQYYGKRSKKGTRNRNGKPLSDFVSGQYLGKSKGLSMGAKIHKKYNKKNKK